MEFDSQRQVVKDALAAITQPTQVAFDAFADQAAQTVADLRGQVVDLSTKLVAAQAELARPQPTGFTDMHMHGNWEVHPGSEQGIGSWTPGTTYSMTQFQKQGDAQYAMKLSIQPKAGGYSDVLWAVHRKPVPMPAANLTLKGRIFPDANTVTGTQCLEIDTLVTAGGLKYNLSSQLNYNKGILQVATGETPWQDTPLTMGKLAANVWHDFQWEYAYDTVNKTLSFVAFNLDGIRYPMPAQFQDLAPVATNWSEGVHLQLQIDANSKGVGFSVYYDNLDYSFKAI